MALMDMQCTAISAGTPPLPDEEVARLLPEVPAWERRDASLTRTWKWKDFPQAMAFVNRIAALAQQENHHPEICIAYNTVHLTLSTHTVGGLSMNDFILAAKIDRLPEAEG